MWIDLEFNRNPNHRFIGVNDSPIMKMYFLQLLDWSWWELVPFHHKLRGTRDFGFFIRIKKVGSLCVEVVSDRS